MVLVWFLSKSCEFLLILENYNQFYFFLDVSTSQRFETWREVFSFFPGLDYESVVVLSMKKLFEVPLILMGCVVGIESQRTPGLEYQIAILGTAFIFLGIFAGLEKRRL